MPGQAGRADVQGGGGGTVMRIGPQEIHNQCRRDWVLEDPATGHPAGCTLTGAMYLFTCRSKAERGNAQLRKICGIRYRVAELTKGHRRHAYAGRLA
jgi:hypothetical protein